MAEWWEDPNINWEAEPDRGPGSVNDWFNQPAATGQRFAIDPSVTQEQLDALPEMTHSERIIEGFANPEEEQGAIRGTLGRMGTGASQAWLNMTMTDPMELGAQLQNRFPDVVEVRLAPNPSEDPEEVEDYPLIPIARNRLTGYEAVINRPGFSGQDILQTIGLVGQYMPAARATSAFSAAPKVVAGAKQALATGRGLLPRLGVAGSTMGATEVAAQTGQAMAGGDFDPEDVALATGFGVLPELIARPAIGLAMKGKELFGRVASAVPNTIRQAMDFAAERGFIIQTSDALAERITAPQQIFLKITERIPVFGTQGAKTQQRAQRADVLREVAEEYGVDIETDLGQEIAENWVSRMKNWRFFGRNQNPTDQMMNRAFGREAAEVIDSTLARRIAEATMENGKIDDVLVDQVFKSNNAVRVRDLFRKLTPDGQRAAQTRFVTEGLNRAGWRPGQQVGISSPATFVKYLDDHANSIDAIFPDEMQRTYMNGIKEFLRITNEAEKGTQGAGMTAALAAGGGFYLFDLMGGAIAGAGTGMLGRAVQSPLARDLFLRLAHAEGNVALRDQYMRQLRPLILAMGNQVLQGEVDMPQLSMAMGPGMIQEGAATGSEAAMQVLRAATQQVNPYAFLGGRDEEFNVETGPLGDVTSIGQGSLFVGPGIGRLPRGGEEPEE